jgi:uncharacterized hydantoinase/oxoprolinase family protein
MLTDEEIVDLAREAYGAQLHAIGEGIEQVALRLRITNESKKKYPVTVAGLGRRFLAAEAARNAGFTQILDLDDVVGHQSALTAPSAAAAIMLNNLMIAKKKSDEQ